MSLKDKVAIVTGSSRGIGKAISIALAKEGANVVIAARTEREEESKLPGTIYKTAREIEDLGARALPIRTDLTSDEETENVVIKSHEEFGKIDILVNNAGVDAPSSFLEMPVKHWDLIMTIHLRATYLLTRLAAKDMIDKGGGHIINISSVAAQKDAGGITSLAYDVAKAAIERFTFGLSKELIGRNISVNALCPGATRTEGMELLFPEIDKTDWYAPEFWGEACVFVCKLKPEDLTGQIITGDKFIAMKSCFGST